MILLLYIMLLLMYAFLIFCSRRISLERFGEVERIRKPFYKASLYLYKKIHLRDGDAKRENKKINTWEIPMQVSEDLKILEPTAATAALEEKYYVEKVSITLQIVLAGLLLAIFAAVSSQANTIIRNEYLIKRNDYEQGSKLVDLTVAGGQMKETIPVEIGEKQYTVQEIQDILPEFKTALEKCILGDNDSPEKITKNLFLPTKLEGYPFTVEWETSDYSLVTSKGELGSRQADAQGELVSLTANITYFEYGEAYSFYVKVYPKDKTKEEAWKENLFSLLEKNENDSKNESYYTLPSQLDGDTLFWKEKRQDTSVMLLFLTIITAFLIFRMKDRDLHVKVENRNREMTLDYPEIVNKMALLIGAGMTIKAAFRKVAEDYRIRKERLGRKRYAYEEMLLTCREMESGVSEINAYDRFGRRTRNQQYRRLSGILCQNLKKGSGQLLGLLEEESREAFEERKALAKKAGEEAGTKMLFPMMIMLGIVIIVIIVPAFLSFSI